VGAPAARREGRVAVAVAADRSRPAEPLGRVAGEAVEAQVGLLLLAAGAAGDAAPRLAAGLRHNA